MKRICYVMAVWILLLAPQLRGQVLWQEVGGGLNGPVTDFAADTSSGLVYMCGTFEEAGGIPTRGSVAWDGQSWVLQGMGAGYADTCTITQCTDFGWIAVNGDNLFVGGENAYLDSNNVYHRSQLTRWDGTHWDTCGLPGDLIPVSCNKQTFLIGANNNAVNGHVIPNVAIWNGVSWDNYTSYLDLEGGYFNCMEYYKGMYHFGGNFRHQPGIKEVAAWDGTQWLPLGNGILGDSWVFEMKSFQGLLFVAGEFNWAVGNAGDYIMAWDGAQWLQTFGENVQFTSQVRNMEVIDGKLYMHGEHFVRRNGVWQGPFAFAKYDGMEFCSFGGQAFPVFDMAGLNGRFYVSASPFYLPGGARWIAEYVGTAADEVCIPVSPPNAVRPAQRDFALVYPNPAHDHATLTMLVSTPGEVHVQLFNATGVMVREFWQMVDSAGSNEINLDLRDLAEGAYIAVASTPDGVVRARLVKQ